MEASLSDGRFAERSTAFQATRSLAGSLRIPPRRCPKVVGYRSLRWSLIGSFFCLAELRERRAGDSNPQPLAGHLVAEKGSGVFLASLADQLARSVSQPSRDWRNLLTHTPPGKKTTPDGSVEDFDS